MLTILSPEAEDSGQRASVDERQRKRCEEVEIPMLLLRELRRYEGRDKSTETIAAMGDHHLRMRISWQRCDERVVLGDLKSKPQSSDEVAQCHYRKGWTCALYRESDALEHRTSHVSLSKKNEPDDQRNNKKNSRTHPKPNLSETQRFITAAHMQP